MCIYWRLGGILSRTAQRDIINAFSILFIFHCFFVALKKKSERPVDALAVKISITERLTTSNQEMLAHLTKTNYFEQPYLGQIWMGMRNCFLYYVLNKGGE